MPTRTSTKKRAKPGSKGEGDYYRIELLPSEEFTAFRYHDVGDPGHLLRLAGKRKDGTWDTQAWLIGKSDAHVEGDHLIADSADAKNLLESLGGKSRHKEGDIFSVTKPKAKKDKAE